VKYDKSSVSELLEYAISFNDDNTLEWEPPVGSKELAIALSYHFPKEKTVEKKMQAATKEFLHAEQRKTRALVSTTASSSVANGTSEQLDGSCSVLEINPSLELLVASETSTSVVPSKNRAFTSKDADHGAQGASNVPKEAQPKSQAPDNGAPATTPKKLKIVSWYPAKKDVERGKKRRYGSKERAKVASNRGYACDEHRRQKVKVELPYQWFLGSSLTNNSAILLFARGTSKS
jgi:hypothetical protein